MTLPPRKRQVFVTGATGYLGARLIPLLLERGHRLTALARQESIGTPTLRCLPMASYLSQPEKRGSSRFRVA